MSENPFERVYGNGFKAGTAQGDGLHLVIIRGCGAMNVHKSKLFRLHPFQNTAQGVVTAFPGAGGAGDMVGIVTDGAGHQFPGGFFALPGMGGGAGMTGEQHGSGGLPQVQPLAGCIERPAGTLGKRLE